MTTTPTAQTARTYVRRDAISSRRATEILDTRFDTHWGRSGVVITAHGEVDAATAGAICAYALRCADRCEWLILDLSDVHTIATQTASSTLRSITGQCAEVGVELSLVTGPALSGLLRATGFRWALPVAESLTSALATVQNRLHATVRGPRPAGRGPAQHGRGPESVH